MLLTLASVRAAITVPWPLTRFPVTHGGAGKPAVSLAAFGGVADGITDNSPAFARAFAHLGAIGGGTLIVPHDAPGSAPSAESVYASLPIRIANISGVTLRLEASTRVLAKCDTVLSGGWPVIPPWSNGIDSGPQYAPLLHAANVTDLVIEGTGTLDGNGSWWYTANSARGHGGKLPHQRPRLVIIEQCRYVSLRNFSTTNSAFWNLVLFQTDDVHVAGVVVRNPSGGKGECGGAFPPGKCYGPNADGIDLVSVRRALVEEMDIVAGDDCICIKSGRDAAGRAVGRPTQAVRARNNRLRSCSCPHVFHGMGDGCGGLKVGTEMSGGVSDVLFENNLIDYAGIALKLSAPIPRGGAVSNITWRGVEIVRAGMVIGIDVNLPGSDPKEPDPGPADVASVRGVVFDGIVVRNLSCCRGCTDYGCSSTAQGGGRNAGWLQAGRFPSAQGSSGVHALTLRNISVLGHTPAAAPLSWICTNGTLFGSSVDVYPAPGANCGLDS
jgi:polygalacturonase